MSTDGITQEDRRIIGADAMPLPVREDQPPAEWPVWALKMREQYAHEIKLRDDRINELENAILNAQRAKLGLKPLPDVAPQPAKGEA